MRTMSFAMTTDQIRNRTKTVTRRMGLLNLTAGEQIRAVKKGMGLKPGEKIEPLAVLRAVSVRHESLDRMLDDEDYGADECKREGFENLSPAEFIRFFCKSHKGCRPDTIVTRIEFAYESNS